MLPRFCTKSYKVPGTDLVIEKGNRCSKNVYQNIDFIGIIGTRVHIPVLGIHRDAQYYPNPEEFNPENFSQENKAIRPDYTWMPFGEGPRMCIGKSGIIQVFMAIFFL